MKKIYSFIALFLMCFVGSVQAQHQWNVVGENLMEGELVAGENNYYVIQEGDNTLMNADTGEEQAGPHSASGYLSNNGCVAEVNHDCIFSFIETGEMKNEYKVYVLKNLANGKYLVSAGNYTSTMAKAFKFTLRKAHSVEEASITKETPWEEYSNAVSATRSIKAATNGAWVFCKPNARLYMCFYGTEPQISSYVDTNNWYIFKAEEEEMKAFDKLVAVYTQYFANGFDATIYPVGTEPGCISQEFFNKVEAIYNEAAAATVNPDTPDAECNRIREAIIAVFAEMDSQVVPVSVGYYVIKNVGGRGFLTVNADASKARGNSALRGEVEYNEWTPASVQSWSLDNAKYIWKVEDAKEEGKSLFKNFGANKYLTTRNGFAMDVENGVSFQINHYAGTEFTMTYGKNSMLHMSNHADGKMLDYNHPEDAASRYVFYKVNSEVIDTLSAKVEQNAKNEALGRLVARVEKYLASVKFKNGFVNNGTYNHPSDSGLVTKLLGANATDPEEGSVAEMFDGKMNTYYHTSWHASVAPEGNHWISVDLGKEVSELIIKFSKRHNVHDGDPRQFKLYAPADGNEADAEWPVELAECDTVIYEYASAIADSSTFIGKFKLNEPARFVRFVVTKTLSNQFPAGEGSGPCWHVSELRFYDAADCVTHPNYELVPEATRNALTDVLAAAKAELAKKAGTPETYDALEKALDAFKKAYPDASSLKEGLKVAMGMAANAKEADNMMGFYQIGAKEVLQTEVEAIAAAIKAVEDAGKALSIADIDKYQARLDKAIADFNAKFVVPEAGKVYRIVCKAGYELNADGSEKLDDDGNTIEKGQNDACIASADADFYKGYPMWSKKLKEVDAEERFNTLWLVEKSEAGFSFKNLANGLYMNNPYEGLTDDSIKNADIPARLGYSQEPKHFKLEGFTAKNQPAEGLFLIPMYKGQYVNLDPQGPVVHWYDRDDTNAAFTFSLVEDADFSSTYKVSVQPGKVQIISLPIALSQVVTKAGSVYEVLGMKDNKIHLNPIADGDVIPAGTPFIVDAQTAEAGVSEGETTIDAIMVNGSLEESLKLTYNYEPVVKNGLVSAPFGFEAEEGAGYGIIFDKSVAPTETGDYIKAGSGFFNNTIPATTEEGELILSVEGKIFGEGTAVENVEVIKNVNSDVYTVAGVKVRQNVKAASATKNLPKGVYIVGGKKIIVK